MKSILMIVSNPFVYDGRVYNEAKTLVDQGYSVTVLGYDSRSEFEAKTSIDGIAVMRIRNDFIDKVLRKRPLQLIRFCGKGYRLIMREYPDRFDVVHCHDLDTLKLGINLKKATNCKLVYDSHEIFLYLIQRDATRYLTGYYRKIEKSGSELSDQLITVDHKHVHYFKSNYHVKNIEVVRNTKRLVSQHYIPPSHNEFQLVYIGTLSKPRFLLESMEVVSELKMVKLVIAGAGPLASQVKSAASGKENVEFLGSIPMDEVLKLTLNSNVVLCMIDPSDSNNRVNPANKQFEAMACGRPIIATEGTRVAEITREENCGIVVEYDKKSLKHGILRLQRDFDLYQRLGMNALEAAKREYNWDVDSAKLLNVHKNLID